MSNVSMVIRWQELLLIPWKQNLCYNIVIGDRFIILLDSDTVLISVSDAYQHTVKCQSIPLDINQHTTNYRITPVYISTHTK